MNEELINQLYPLVRASNGIGKIITYSVSYNTKNTWNIKEEYIIFPKDKGASIVEILKILGQDFQPTVETDAEFRPFISIITKSREVRKF